MGCYKRLRGIKISYGRDELLYDIKNVAYVEGDVAHLDDEHSRHPIIDIGEDGNVDRVTRVMNLAFEECVDYLYGLTKRPLVTFRDNDDFTEPDTYTLRLWVDCAFSDTSVAYLRELVHEYIVCRVLWDWLSITYPGAEQKWRLKADEAKAKMKEALSKRFGRVRRTLTPF